MDDRAPGGASGRGSARLRRRADARERHEAVTEVGPVLDAAARFLEVRPRSVAEVRRRLASAGYPAGLVEAAIARLTDAGYLDDAAFARAWVESRDRARPRGEIALRRELRLKGVDPATTDAALEARRAGAVGADAGVAWGARSRTPASGSGTPPADDDDGTYGDVDLSAAARVLERRAAALLRVPEPRRRWQRAYAVLARNGFDPETCRAAVAAWSSGAGGSPSPDEDEGVEPEAEP